MRKYCYKDAKKILDEMNIRYEAMEHKKKRSQRMLLNFYNEETHEMCKKFSLNSVLRWLAETNRNLVRKKGRSKILEEEEKLREIGW
jgi:hypothetical protein